MDRAQPILDSRRDQHLHSHEDTQFGACIDESGGRFRIGSLGIFECQVRCWSDLWYRHCSRRRSPGINLVRNSILVDVVWRDGSGRQPQAHHTNIIVYSTISKIHSRTVPQHARRHPMQSPCCHLPCRHLRGGTTSPIPLTPVFTVPFSSASGTTETQRCKECRRIVWSRCKGSSRLSSPHGRCWPVLCELWCFLASRPSYPISSGRI